MARIGRFLARHNRILIGWDEILEGTADGRRLPPNAVIMSWRVRFHDPLLLIVLCVLLFCSDAAEDTLAHVAFCTNWEVRSWLCMSAVSCHPQPA